MTDYEYGKVSRLVSILLLGFLLPQSTGNEFFILQNLSSVRKNKDNNNNNTNSVEYLEEKEDMGEYIVSMPLEERLECCPYRYNADEAGEFDSIGFIEPLEMAFQSFLKNGLIPFFSGRPVHTTEVDLLHIIAMAIHPQPSEQSIVQTSSTLEDKHSEAWEVTKRLMSNLTPHSFQINYQYRLQLVQIVTDCLIIPDSNKLSPKASTPLFEGALPHLRASLYAFGMASISPYDAHVANSGLVSLAIQSGINYVVKEEWSRLLHRLVDDRTNYPNCKQCTGVVDTSDGDNLKDTTNFMTESSSTSTAFSLVTCKNNKCFCPHQARGDLLREFLTRCCEARHFAEDLFLQHALGSLTDAIEMQVDCWSKGEPEEEEDDDADPKSDDADAAMKDGKEETTNHPPCVLASLLRAAKHLFYFLLALKTEPNSDNKEAKEADDDSEEEESEESHRRDMLVSCGIQLVHHWDPIIVKEACTMLVLAFSYSEEMWEDYVGACFDSTKISFENFMKKENKTDIIVPIEGLVSAFSKKSLTFAMSFMRLLLKKESLETGNLLVSSRLVAAVATARPSVAEKHRDILEEHLKEAKDGSAKKHFLAAILACRKARYFGSRSDSETYLLPLISSASLGGWDQYQIARQALLTGNFAIAKHLYNQAANSASSETSFIWLSALENIADAEASLSLDTAMALPHSTEILRAAVSSLRSLSTLATMCGDNAISTDFQIRFVDQRISFLDLLTCIRQLTREMRLVGYGPRKYTRPRLHLKKIVKSFDTLGQQYLELYKQFGLFICQESRSSLRTLEALCLFVGRALRRVFVDSLADSPADKTKKVDDVKQDGIPKGDSSQPMTLLMKQLESFALKDMDSNVDGKIRAAAMLEIIDGILKAPIPLPRDLTSTKPIPSATLRLMYDPEEHGYHVDTLEVGVDNTLSILASGVIPRSLLQRSQMAFNTVLLWYKVSPIGTISPKLLPNPLPIATSLSPSGTFFVKKFFSLPPGRYELNFRLGCRDLRGGEWEIPLKETPPGFSVMIAQSN